MPRQPLMVNPMRRIPYPAPGEILLQEFLMPMNFTQYRLAKEIGVPQRRVGEIVAGKRGIAANTDLCLAQFSGNSEGFRTSLQDDHHRAIPKKRSPKRCIGSRHQTHGARRNPGKPIASLARVTSRVQNGHSFASGWKRLRD